MPVRARRIVYALSALLGILAVASALALTRFDRRTDFRIFYQSALAWRNGQPLYPYERPNLNPPAVVVAYAPLTYLSERNALGVFTLIGIACAIAASWQISQVVPHVPWFVLASLIVALEGGWTNLWLGQEGLILMLVTTLAWRADRDRRSVAAGVWTAVAVYTKPFLAGILVYWIWRRQWRAIGSALAAAAALVLAGAVLSGPSSYLFWSHSLSIGPAPYSPLNASLLGLWSRLFFGSEFAPPLLRQAPPVLLTAWVLSMVAMVIAIYRRVSATGNVDMAWALILIGSVLASPLGWVYYLPIAAGPLAATVGGAGSWVCLWASAYTLLLFRSNLLAGLHTTAGLAVTIGSAYAWATVLLFFVAWLGRPRASAAAHVTHAPPSQTC